jgi:hypothetical protein
MNALQIVFRLSTIILVLVFSSCSSDKQQKVSESTDSVKTPLVENTEIEPNQIPDNKLSFAELFQTLSEPITTEFPIQVDEAVFEKINQNDEFSNDTLAEPYLLNSQPFLKFIRQKNSLKDSYKDYLIYHHYKRFEVSTAVDAVIFYAIPAMQGTSQMYLFELFTFDKKDGSVIDHTTIATRYEESSGNDYSISTTSCKVNKKAQGFDIEQITQEKKGALTESDNEDNTAIKSSTAKLSINTEGKITH